MKLSSVKKGRGHVDSPAKKLVRLNVFETAQGILGKNFYTGMYLGLASKEAGDYGTLAGLGVPVPNIVMCDLDPDAIEGAKARWFPGLQPVLGNIHDIAQTNTWHMINYDTCAPLRENTSEEVLALARTIRPNGLLCCWFLAGREHGGTMEQIRVMEELLAEETKGMKLKTPKGVLADRLTYIARSLLLEQNLNTQLSVSKKHTRLIRIWTYTSTDVVEGKIGSPMVVTMIQIKNKPRVGNLANDLAAAIQHDHFMVVGDCRQRLSQKAVELMEAGRPAGVLLNSRDSEAAWKAHKTRGTYGR